MSTFPDEPGEVPAVLTEAYVADLIDVETYERFVGLCVAGGPVALPAECFWQRARPDDRPGVVFEFNPVMRAWRRRAN